MQGFSAFYRTSSTFSLALSCFFLRHSARISAPYILLYENGIFSFSFYRGCSVTSLVNWRDSFCFFWVALEPFLRKSIWRSFVFTIFKELKENFNYGLFYPPSNGRAGKFLDDERPLSDYPFTGPVGYLEVSLHFEHFFGEISFGKNQFLQSHAALSDLTAFFIHYWILHCYRKRWHCFSVKFHQLFTYFLYLRSEIDFLYGKR